MATNTFQNVVSIAAKAMDVIENNLVFTKFVNRSYDPMFRETGAKVGDTVNIRIPGFQRVRSGPTADPQGYNDTARPITVNQSGVDLQFTEAQLRLNVEDGDAFMRNVLEPMVAPLANSIDRTGLALVSQIYQATGTPGTSPTDLSAFLDAKAELNESGVPVDNNLAAVIGPRAESSLVNGLKGLFQSSTEIARQYEEGTMGIAAGMKFSMDQNVASYTTGQLGGSPVIASVPADGATSISTSGWTASRTGVLKAGDVFTIAGVFKVNPVEKQPTATLQKFVVVADVNSDGSGNATIQVSPSLTLTGPNQNITALPAASAAITPLSAASKTTSNNIVFHKDAFCLVTVDMPKPQGVEVTRMRSKKLGIPFRFLRWYDGFSDTELFRLDVLYGWTVLRPTYACRVQS